MAGGGDVYISFGGDTAGLEAALSVAKAEVQNLQREMGQLGREMQKTGATSDSELGQSLRAMAENLVGAKSHAKDLSGELSNLGGKGQQAGGFLSQLSGGISNAKSALSDFAAAIPGVGEAMAAAFSIAAITELTEAMTVLGRETTKASEVLGIPLKDVASLGLIAKASGMDLGSLEMSFTRLSRNITEQSDSAKRAMAALGLSFDDLKGKDANEQLRILADTFSKIKDGSDKDAIGVALFGRTFDNLLPLLNEGRGALDAWNQVAAETGATLDKETTSAMAETERQMIRLGSAIQGDGISVFREFAPAINGIVKMMADLAIEFSKAMNEGGNLKTAVDGIRFSLQFTESTIVGSITALRILTAVSEGAAAGLASAFMTSGEVIKDVFLALASGSSAFFTGLIDAAKSATHIVGQEFIDLGTIIADAFSGDVDGAEAAWGRMGTDAADAGTKIKEALSKSISGFDFSKAGEDSAKGMDAMVARTKQTGDEIARIGKQTTEELATIWGIGGEAIKAKTDQISVHMAAVGNAAGKAAHEAAMQAIESLNEEMRATQDASTQKRKAIDDALAHQRIGMNEWLSESKSALNSEAENVRAIYEKELALANLTSSEKIKIKIAEIDALRKIQDMTVGDERKAADEIAKKWQQAADKIETSMASAIKGMVTGSVTPIQTLAHAIDQLGNLAIDWALKMAETWVMGELSKTASTTANAATRTASVVGEAAASNSVTLGSLIKSITASASEAFAGVTGFLSPVMGPAAVGPAAATQATVMSVGLGGLYDSGSFSVPNDMVAGLHKGEVVIPQRGGLADEFRSMVANGGIGGGKSGGDTHLHVHALDVQSFIGYMKNNGRDLAKLVRDQFNDNHSLRPSY